jgi:hypothetical protein
MAEFNFDPYLNTCFREESEAPLVGDDPEFVDG